MLLGMLLFSLNDVLGKWMVATYAVGQVLLIRSLAGFIILVPFVWMAGWKKLVHVERPRLQIGRAILTTLEVFAFYYAVSFLPLADVMAYWLAAPIYVAAVSPFLLGEKVGPRRWTAIALGFVGVLIVLEPSAQSINIYTGISILGSMAFAFIMVSGRSLKGTPDITLVFWQTASALVAGLLIAPLDWTPVSVPDLALLSLLGVVAMLAHILVNRALKLADAATVAPLQYTLLFWAVLFGWLVFGDSPRWSMLGGAALIMASGLFIFYRERYVKSH
ncbi:DMT family transporter [Paraburkholderia aspalathi]|nr:DMT family transporter [Paraburkholderia aspalathi]